MDHYHTKVCILGAGPAGLTASLYLSRFGIPHILIDRARFPRDKVCGESFDGRVYRILDDLAILDDLRREDAVFAGRYYRLNSKLVDLSVRIPQTGLPRLSVDRRTFDEVLYRRAVQSDWVRPLSGESFEVVRTADTGCRLQGERSTIETELLVVATGAQPHLEPERSRWLFSRWYYEGVRSDTERGLEIYYFDQPAGASVFLCALTRDRYNVELAIEKQTYRELGMSMDDLLEHYIRTHSELCSRFAAARLLQRAKGTVMELNSRICWSGPGMVYVGARALCVHPITGLGVGNAMSMGRLVAEIIAADGGEEGLARRVVPAYQQAVARKLRPIIWRNRLLNLMHRHYGRLEPLLALGFRLPWIRKLLAN